MAKLITTEQISKLLGNEYDVPLGVSCYVEFIGIIELKLEYVADSVILTEKGKSTNMPMNVFKTYYGKLRWLVNTIGELSSTEIDMAINYIISKENSNEK